MTSSEVLALRQAVDRAKEVRGHATSFTEGAQGTYYARGRRRCALCELQDVDQTDPGAMRRVLEEVEQCT